MGLPRFMLKLLQLKNNIGICRNICCDIDVRNKSLSNNLQSSILTVTDHNDSEINTRNALDKASVDLSDVAPYFRPSFNFAAYVNKSEILQNLIKLNVDLSKIEKKPYIAEKILKLDFDQNIKRHIFFLKDYVELEKLGNFITKNPMILCEPLDDLKVRLNYLRSKRFSDIQIRRIVTQNTFWLMFSTKRIDRRLGHFQEKFMLSGEEVRQLSSRQPKLITYNLHHVNTNTFVIKEEMGFEDSEMKHLILNKPKLWMMNQKTLLERFNYLHNEMKISQSMLLQFPDVLFCRAFKIKQRHLFLKNLGRAQFDPKKENYVPITDLAFGTDTEFCEKYAKCIVSDFNTFLKTL